MLISDISIVYLQIAVECTLACFLILVFTFDRLLENVTDQIPCLFFFCFPIGGPVKDLDMSFNRDRSRRHPLFSCTSYVSKPIQSHPTFPRGLIQTSCYPTLWNPPVEMDGPYICSTYVMYTSCSYRMCSCFQYSVAASTTFCNVSPTTKK